MSRADHGDGQSALFRGIVNSSADAIAVIDPQMRLVYASPSGWQLLGYEPTELLGKDLLQVVHPDDAKAVREHFTRTLACLLYTSDAADDLLCVDLGGRRII